MKTVKWILLGVGALVVIAAAVVAYLVATFDPAAYMPRVIDLVKRQTGRTLTVQGKIGLRFFPKIAVSIEKVSLSEPSSPAIFARVEEARVAVALLPLLSRRVIVDRVRLKGLEVDLVRGKDGHTNFDDLTGRAARPAKPGEAPAPSPPGPPLAIDVGGVEMEDASINWRDEAAGTSVRLSNVTLTTGRLASGVPGKLGLQARIQGTQPATDLRFSMDTQYRLDLETQAVALSSLDARVVGDAAGFSGIDARVKGGSVDLDPKAPRVTFDRLELTARAKDGLDAKISVPRLMLAPDLAESQAVAANVALATPPRAVSVKLRVAPLVAKGKRIEISRVDVELAASQPDLSAQGKLATPLTVDLDKRQAELAGITGELTLSSKSIPSTKATVRGSTRADWGSGSANAQLAVKLDDSHIDARVAVTHWSRPAIAFSVVADRLDLDRYFPPARPAPARGSGSGGGSAPAAGGPPVEPPFDLSALKTLDATGDVKIAALRASNVKAERVALAIKAAGGKLDVSPISASLYQGTLAGSAVVNANDNTFEVRQRLAGVSVGPLLRDAADKDLLEGRGDVVLDVTANGRTVTALKKTLAGTASVMLKDGAIKGVDIAAILRAAGALLGSKGALEQQAQGGAKTDFTELSANFLIRHGVAHNEDLRVTSPALRVTGRGDIDVGEGTLDYTAKAALTAAAARLGGKDLAQLAGVAVPVRATGPLANPKYTVDVLSLAGEVAKGTLQREIERSLRGGKSDGQQGGGAVGDVLRGLFGKPK